MSHSVWSEIMTNHRNLAVVALLGALAAVSAVDVARAQQAIGSATTAQNQVTRELGGASAPLTAGEFGLSQRSGQDGFGFSRQARLS